MIYAFNFDTFKPITIALFAHSLFLVTHKLTDNFY